MIKKLFCFLCLGLILPAFIFAQAGISIKLGIPGKVDAGKEFNVNVVIKKGALEEFSRFQQELPAGLTAAALNSGTADFSFDKQRLRFIWLKLPPQEEINISYKVMVDERLKGQFTIPGEFSYVEKDERKSLAVNSDPIIIQPSPSVNANLQVDISEFAKVISAEKAATGTSYNISCIRQKPYKMTTGNEFIVKLLIYKKDMNKFAKIEEQIPDGFDAKSVDSKDGIFTYKDGLVKFVWMNLPPEQAFVVSYRLIPLSSKTISEVPIKGQLSYIDEGRNIVIEIVQKDLDLAGANAQNVEQYLSSTGPVVTGPSTENVTESPGEESKAIKEVTITKKEETQPPVTESRTIKEETKTAEKEESTPIQKEQGKRYSDIPPTLSLPVQAGIYYRIQLAATHRIVDPLSNYKKYNLDRPVLLEFHDGWYKYSIGSFEKYSDAQAYRDMLITSKRIRGAFIVAYENGKRIEVRDAWRLGGKN
jgi:hypothetical protein